MEQSHSQNTQVLSSVLLMSTASDGTKRCADFVGTLATDKEYIKSLRKEVGLKLTTIQVREVMLAVRDTLLAVHTEQNNELVQVVSNLAGPPNADVPDENTEPTE